MSSPRTAAPPLDAEAFAEPVRLANPFAVNRVMQPSAADVDAGTVHEEPFRRLIELARMACDQHCGLGLVLWGEAGVGKSHLLSRLWRWADHDQQACFLYLSNLQASPEALLRSLLKAVVSILTEGRTERLHETRLGQLLQAALPAAGLPETEVAWGQLVERLSRQGPAHAPLVDRTTYDVLFRCWNSARLAAQGRDDGTTARLAVRWLSGDYLDPAEARQLGLPPGPSQDQAVALADDQQIKLVLVALSQLASLRRVPFLLCFDQVENLAADQVTALARFLQAVLDSAPNLLVVTCGVQEQLAHWRAEGVVPIAAWDRIAQFELCLHRVNVRDARRIVQVRLERFLEPFLELGAIRDGVHRDDLFPLGQAWSQEFLDREKEVRPRDAINWARLGWERQQQALRTQGAAVWLANWGQPLPPPPRVDLTAEERNALIDRKVEAKLAEQREQRRLAPATLPPDAGNLAGLVQVLAQQCVPAQGLTAIARIERPRRGPRPALDLVARRGDETIGLVFVTTASATSVTASLRRLANERLPPRRLLLVGDQRVPLRCGARGEEYVAQLRQQYGERFQQIELSFEHVAALDALAAVVGMAQSGDLEIELPGGQVQRVSREEAIASHHRQGRYAAQPLLALLLGQVPPKPEQQAAAKTSPPPRPGSFTLDRPDVEQVIMSRLALMPGATSHELTIYYVEYLKKKQQVAVEPEVCRPQLEAIARSMHDQGLVHATPTEDGLYLLPRRRG
jgi:hypothetical protein